MKKYLFLSFVLVSVLFTSCIPSLHPLYTDDTIVKFTEIIGQWEDEQGDIINIKEMTFSQGRALILQETNDQDSFVSKHIMVFVELKGHTYVDFFPVDLLDETMFRADILPVHLFARVDYVGDQMTFVYPDTEEMITLFQQGKVRLRHEFVQRLMSKEDSFLLTASSEELQAFIGRYGTDEKLFNLKTTMKRKAL